MIKGERGRYERQPTLTPSEPSLGLKTKAIEITLPHERAFDLTAKDESWEMARYLEVGRIKANRPEMRTGDDGTITVKRLPEGKMTWWIWLEEGQIYDSFQVSADAPIRLVIEMPE